MRIFGINRINKGVFAAFAAAVALWSWAMTPAVAQNSFLHVWVSGVAGTDSSTCGDISSPCKSWFQGVQNVAAGGEVECRDATDITKGTPPSGFPEITKSLNITCDIARSTASDTGSLSYFVVNISAGQVVTIRGMKFDIGSPGGFAMLQFTGAGTLVVDGCMFTGSHSPGGGAIRFAPNGASKLVVTNSLFSGTTGDGREGGAGVQVIPQAGGSAEVELDHVTMAYNLFGVAADGSQSTAGINMTISDSVLSANTNDGVVATTSAGGAPIGVALINTKSTNNGFGVRSIGAKVTVRVDNSRFFGNGTGVSALSGGALLSAGNNIVEANGTNGAFTGSVAFK